VIKGRRLKEKVRVRAIEKRYEERKLAAMEKNRGEGLKKSRMEFAKQWVLLDFADLLPLAADYKAKMALTKGERQTVTCMLRYYALPCLCTVLIHSCCHTHHTPYTIHTQAYAEAGGYTQTEKDEWTKEIYETIVYGFKYPAGETNTSGCTDKSKKCGLKCTAPMAQWRKHMEQHVVKLLALVEDGTIKKPEGPSVPEFFENLRGDISLGGESLDAVAAIEHRRRIFNAYMSNAIDSPANYSPIVAIPTIDDSLVDRKIEVRCKMHPEDESLSPFMHCFEGTITTYAPATPTARAKLDCATRSKHAVVKTRIDDDCLHDDADDADEWLTIPLNAGLYANEGVDKGWTILAEDFVNFEQEQALAAAQEAQEAADSEQRVVAAFHVD
jgi:hypothetical protein